jgi:hypothetical protein
MVQSAYNRVLGYKYAHMSGAQSLVVKTSAGVISNVLINNASNGSTISIYDSNSASTLTPVIGIATIGAAIVGPGINTMYPGDSDAVTTNTGILVVTTGTIDITIIYN